MCHGHMCHTIQKNHGIVVNAIMLGLHVLRMTISPTKESCFDPGSPRFPLCVQDSVGEVLGMAWNQWVPIGMGQVPEILEVLALVSVPVFFFYFLEYRDLLGIFRMVFFLEYTINRVPCSRMVFIE